jgi:hypothetical protein
VARVTEISFWIIFDDSFATGRLLERENDRKKKGRGRDKQRNKTEEMFKF